jgi:membrane protein DedA with SNARE-associated domain
VSDLTHFVTDVLSEFLAHWGVWAVFWLMFIDAVLPAASELVMVYGGALASGALAHDLSVFGTERSGFWAYVTIALAGTVGYTLGAIFGWAIGLYGGRPFLEKHGRWFHLGPERLERAERWFMRYEDWAVFVGRLLPVVRSFVSIPAGVFEAPIRHYTVMTLLGSAIWCFALAGVGWALGSQWEQFHHAFRYADYAVAAAIVAAVAYLVLRHRRRRSISMAGRADSSR